MTRPATSVCPRETAAVASDGSSGDLLLRTFTAMRDELVSTLCFVLGNADDAQDIAQEVFLRCWRTKEGIPDVQNLRAWIFRVGLNAAKDLQRSAWRRKVKPLLGADAMPMSETVPPTRGLEEQESMQQLRQALMKHPEQFVRTMTAKMMTYALGRGLEYYDIPTVRSIERAATGKNDRFSELVLGIVKSAPFQMKKAQAADTASR